MTDDERAKWCLRIHGEIFRALPFLSGAATNLVLAHLALESGYGAARAAQRGHNLGNLTAGPYWLGDKWTDVGGDTDSKGERITQTWRIYDSVSEFLNDYWRFLGPAANTGRYVLARNALERGVLDQFGALLGRSGYFELAPSEYVRRLTSVFARVTTIIATPPIARPAVPPAAPTGP
jgi:flagellum-specific peptidoglycan hydrolase FlgJ